MLPIKTMEYIDISDICDLFDVNIRDFAFTDDLNNGEFTWFSCTDSWIEDYQDCAEDVAGSRYEARYLNNIKLAEYLRKEMGLKDGAMIHVHW